MEMNFAIRKAKKEDSAQIAPLIYDAIGNIAYRITGTLSEEKMLERLQQFVEREDNRHSYLYTYVAEDNVSKDILGMIVLYDGKTGYALDRALEKWLDAQYNEQVTIDVEAHLDEFYIDTLCVSPTARGRGIGSALLLFAEQTAILEKHSKLSLNVEVQKEKARALYEKLGFLETEPWTIIEEPFIHMVKELN